MWRVNNIRSMLRSSCCCRSSDFQRHENVDLLPTTLPEKAQLVSQVNVQSAEVQSLIASLEKLIELDHRLLYQLVSSKVIKTNDIESFKHHIDKLLHFMSSVEPSNWLEQLMQASTASGQQHVSNWIQYRGKYDHEQVGDCWPLTTERQLIIQGNLCKLVEYMDSNDDLMSELTSANCMLSSQLEVLQHIACLDERNGQFLQMMIRRSRGDVDKIVQCLEKTHQRHVVPLITGTADEEEHTRPLSDVERARVRNNWGVLIDMMEPRYELLPKLYTDNCISQRQRNSIWCFKDPAKKNEILLQIILRKSFADFNKFIKCLIESDQQHVAKLLNENTDCIFKSNINKNPQDESDAIGQQQDTDAVAHHSSEREQLLKTSQGDLPLERDAEGQHRESAVENVLAGKDVADTVTAKLEDFTKTKSNMVNAILEKYEKREEQLHKLQSSYADQLLTKVNQLQKQLQDCRRELATYNNTHIAELKLTNNQQQELHSLQMNKLEETSAENRKQVDEIQKYLTELKDSKETATKQEAKVKMLKKELNDSKDTATEREKRMNMFEKELKDSRDTATKHEEMVNILEKELNDYKDTATKHEDRVTILEKELNDSKDTATKHEDKVKHLEEELNVSKDTATKQENRVKMLEEELTYSKDTATKHEDRVNTLEKDLSVVKDELATKQATTQVATMNEVNKSTQTHVIPGDHIVGMTSLNNQLFIVRRYCQEEIEVYEIKTFTLQRKLRVKGLKDSIWIQSRLASCATNNCLYVSDLDNNIVYRVELTANNNVFKWKVGSGPIGLSVNNACNVLVTCHNVSTIQEYTTRGSLVREIRIQAEVTYPVHTIQLTNGHYVVSHWEPVNGVSVVDSGGRVVVSYRNEPGSQIKLLYYPGQLAVDKNDYILVADRDNNRIVLLNSSFEKSRDLPVVVDGGLKDPWCLYLDESRDRIYVGEYRGGCVLVMDNVVNLMN